MKEVTGWAMHGKESLDPRPKAESLGLSRSQKAVHEGLQGSSVMSDVSRPFPPRNGVCVG